MAEKKERTPEERRERRESIQQLLLGLGGGLTADSRGGNFSAGLGQGLQTFAQMQDRRLQADARQAQQAQAERRQHALARLGEGMGEDERALFDAFPDQYVKSRLATPKDKSTTKQRDYEFLVESGMAKDDAFNAIFGSKGMSLRTNPDGTFELVQGKGADLQMAGAPLKLREQEAKFGLFATQAMDSHAQLNTLEETINPTSLGNSAFTMLSETPLLGRFAENIPAEDMKNYNAELGRFIDGWARAMTGAAMPDSERIFYRSMIGARPGDGESVRKRKARNREIMALSLQQGAGKGAQIADRVKAQMADPYAGESEGGDAPRSIEEMSDAELRAIIGAE